jgi:hypothetical protein
VVIEFIVKGVAECYCRAFGHDDVPLPEFMVPADVRASVTRPLFCMRCWRIDSTPRERLRQGAYR